MAAQDIHSFGHDIIATSTSDQSSRCWEVLDFTTGGEIHQSYLALNLESHKDGLPVRYAHSYNEARNV